MLKFSFICFGFIGWNTLTLAVHQQDLIKSPLDEAPPEGHCWFLCNFVPFPLQSNANIYMLVVHILRQAMLNTVFTS